MTHPQFLAILLIIIMFLYCQQQQVMQGQVPMQQPPLPGQMPMQQVWEQLFLIIAKMFYLFDH